MVSTLPTSANDFIEQQLNERLSVLEKAFDADGLCVIGPMINGMDDIIRNLVEELRQRPEARNRLVVLLTTNGGYIETVQRIVETLRHHYSHVSFVIPNFALSAGTVLAKSGDEIFMDYYSRLGPIDPQVENEKGVPVPALGYLIQWERLLEKAASGGLTAAETQLLIDGFDQAALYQYEQARELSVRLLKQWLVEYKFKNWKVTATSKTPVTPEMRQQRAEEIGRLLNDTNRWHSHAIGISKEVLEGEINLLIDDLDENKERGEAVKQYYGLLSDYMMRLGLFGSLHTVRSYVPLG